MKSLTPFEARLLEILRGCLRSRSGGPLIPLVMRGEERPTGLSRAAIELVEDTLRKGITHWLASRGWCQEGAIRNGQRVTGRLWERTGPEQLGLEFTPQTLDFLLWLTSHDFAGKSSLWTPRPGPLPSVGDQLVFFLVMDSLRDLPTVREWHRSPTFARHGLCRLFLSLEMAVNGEPGVPDFRPWLTSPGLEILEAVQDEWAARLVQLERKKRQLATYVEVVRVGREQEATYGAFLAAIDAAGRRDLARPFLAALETLSSSPGDDGEFSWREEYRKLRMNERQEVQRALRALWNTATTLRGWWVESQRVGYFDDDYQQSQLWKDLWERYNGARLGAAKE